MVAYGRTVRALLGCRALPDDDISHLDADSSPIATRTVVCCNRYHLYRCHWRVSIPVRRVSQFNSICGNCVDRCRGRALGYAGPVASSRRSLFPGDQCASEILTLSLLACASTLPGTRRRRTFRTGCGALVSVRREKGSSGIELSKQERSRINLSSSLASCGRMACRSVSCR